MKKFIRYFFVGVLSLIPLIVVINVILWVNSYSTELFLYVSSYTKSTSFTITFFIIIIILLIAIGSSIEKFGKSLIISLIDKILENIPAINSIYSIMKKITALFTTNEKNEKKEVVLIEYPKKDIWVPAYVLNKYENSLVLFIPTSPNPTSGYTIITQQENIKNTTLTIAEASQFIISMGADFVKQEEITNIINNSNNKMEKK